MLRYCALSFTSTHTSCYAKVGSLKNVEIDVDAEICDNVGTEAAISFLSLFNRPH